MFRTALLAALLAAPPAALVARLGSPVYAEREAASGALWRRGEAGRAALARAAAESPDAEVARRARDILARLDRADYADSPPPVRSLVAEVLRTPAGARPQLLGRLARRGPAGLRAAARLYEHQLPETERHAAGAELVAALRAEVPLLLATNRAGALALLSQESAALPFPELARDRTLLAWQLAPDSPAPKSGTPADLAYAAHWRGEASAPGRMKALAESLRQPRLAEAALAGAGDWAALAELPVAEANSAPGLRALRLTLAGRNLAALTPLWELLRAGPDPGSWDGSAGPATAGLLLNAQTEAGIAKLRRDGGPRNVLADIHAARLEFPEALAALELPPRAEPGSRAAVAATAQLRRGRLLWRLGDPAGAAAAFERAASELVGVGDPLAHSVRAQLLRAEIDCGQAARARRHLALGLAREPNLAPECGLLPGFEAAFGPDADFAALLWQATGGERSAARAAGRLDEIDALLGGAAKPARLDAALGALGALGESSPADRRDATRTRATLLERAGRIAEARAERAAELPAPPPDARRLVNAKGWVFGTDEDFLGAVEAGDALSRAGDHAGAAELLRAAWWRDPANPVLAHLAGAEAARGGDPAGRDCGDLAHLVPLSRAEWRGRLIQELLERGRDAAAWREAQLCARAAPFAGNHAGNVWNQVGRAATAAGQFEVAAAAQRHVLLHLLRTPGYSFIDGAAYVNVPHSVALLSARQAVAEGRAADAERLLGQYRAQVPGDAPGLGEAVREFAEAGELARAARVSAAVAAPFRRLLAEYPNSAWLRSRLAVFYTSARREPAEALALAKDAVRLDPEVRAFHEVLAEAAFRAGERELAVAWAARVAQADRGHLARRRLAFYRAGAFTDAMPAEE